MLIPINTAAAGDTTLLAAVAGKRIRVHRAVLVNQVATAQPIKFRTGATDLHAAIPLPSASCSRSTSRTRRRWPGSWSSRWSS
jgi:hypothetical protein